MEGDNGMLLSPYRVLDLTDEKGYFAGKILADLGADVIKIECPEGDPGRKKGPWFHDEMQPEKSLFWFAYNTNKRGITLNIETTTGQEIFKKLCKTADSIVESFPLGYMNECGLGWEQLSSLFPHIVMTSITFFGERGTYKMWKGCDLVTQAMGGMMYFTGEPDRTPLLYGGADSYQSYLQAGAQAAVGTLLALYHGAKMGRGQHVEVSIAEAMVWGALQPWWYEEWELEKNIARRQGTRSIRGKVSQRVCFRCKDGYISIRIFVGAQGHFTQRLVEWMEAEGVAGDLVTVDWTKIDLRKVSQEQVEQYEKKFESFFLAHTREELKEQAIKRGFVLFPINEPWELLEDVQLDYRGFFTNVEFPGFPGGLKYPGRAIYEPSQCQPKVVRRAPLVGEHNEEVYIGQLGLSVDDVKLLKHAGII